MKKYLIDVPVKLNIWIRPECQKKQFEVVKKARPSILFLQSDGGRNEKEWGLIYKNRKYVESEIDWDCKVYKLYEDNNNGIYACGEKTVKLIWDNVDRCIFLEDDQIPSVSFFQFCAELLEKYKNDERIECICGMNNVGIYDNADADYFFAKHGSIWGYATWKRACEKKYDYYNNNYVMSLLKQKTKTNRTLWKRINAYGKHKYYEGHVASDEFWIEFDVYSNNRLQIIPKYNLISNIGDGDDSIHFKKVPLFYKKLLNMQTYEYSFPLNHPKYVICDDMYDKLRDKKTGYNRPFLKKVFDHLIILDFDIFVRGIKNLFYKDKPIEK